ncbi:hypothetical protein KM043_018815 [Ampulex compressa]|nr:hypothetical protein KM043_018815 [Ampulex compressa]
MGVHLIEACQRCGTGHTEVRTPWQTEGLLAMCVVHSLRGATRVIRKTPQAKGIANLGGKRPEKDKPKISELERAKAQPEGAMSTWCAALMTDNTMRVTKELKGTLFCKINLAMVNLLGNA